MATSSTRQLILDYLQNHSQATSADLAQELGLSPAGIRYHLGLLRKAGLVTSTEGETDRHINPGRPFRPIRLTAANQPDNLERLSSSLLRVAILSLPVDQLVEQLAAQLIPEPPHKLSLPRRLAYTLTALNQQHYEVRWEARKQGPRVIFQRCPYADIWPEFPFLCIMDQRVLSRLLVMPVYQIQNIHKAEDKKAGCIFQTGANTANLE
jgi:predicted ArsR family transcriptional regulator